MELKNGLPPSVDSIIDDLWQMSAVYGYLKWNEHDRLKADMINARQRWLPVDPVALKAKCVAVGFPERSVRHVMELLKRTQRGDRMIAPKGEKTYRFPEPVEPRTPPPRPKSSRDW